MMKVKPFSDPLKIIMILVTPGTNYDEATLAQVEKIQKEVASWLARLSSSSISAILD